MRSLLPLIENLRNRDRDSGPGIAAFFRIDSDTAHPTSTDISSI
jgi:hypothetical protein